MEYIFTGADRGCHIAGILGKKNRRKRLLEMMRILPANAIRLAHIKLLEGEAPVFGSIEENSAIEEFKKFTDPELFWTWAYGDLFLLEESKYPLLIVSSLPEQEPAENMDSLTWFRSKMQ